MGKIYFGGEIYGDFWLIFREFLKIFSRNTVSEVDGDRGND